MAKTIHQQVTFKASPKAVYETYMNPKKHAKAIGGQCSLQGKVGGHFSAFTMLKGKFLYLAKNQKIVQTWRAKTWKKKDPDSILIWNLKKVRGGTRLEMIHIGIPDYDYRDCLKGWPTYYWKPWRRYLKGKK